MSSSSASASSLPSAGPRVPSPGTDEADAICKSDFIHQRRSRSGECQEPTSAAPFTTRASQPPANTPSTPARPPPASTTRLPSAATSSPTASTSPHAWAASFGSDADSLRRADEEYVLGLIGARMPDEASVQQRRQQLSADQQTASQFAGTEASQRPAASPVAAGLPPSPAPPKHLKRRNKAETKAEARNDRHQGEFDQAGQRISQMSASQSLKDMEDAKHRQTEQIRKAAQRGGSEAEREQAPDSERTKPQQQQQQQAPPRPLDDRRPGGEVKDGAAPWSE